MERIKWRYSEKIVNYINTNNIPILAIVGATGSGKSTLASYLELQYPKLKIIRNYTTRTKRNTDCETHFGYISEYEFCEMMKADAFFLARYQEFPFYGYRNEDLLNIINAGQIPLFMFRYSGTNIITKIIKNVYIVLIECDYKKAAVNSRDIVTVPTFESIVKTYSSIDESLKSYSGKVLRLRNLYDSSFFSEGSLHNFIEGMINDR